MKNQWLLWACAPLFLFAPVLAEVPLPLITKISVTGNNRIKTETILHRFSYHEAGFFDAQKSKLAIESLYNAGDFSLITIEQETDPETENGVQLFVTVKERPTVSTVIFQGSTVFKDEKLKEITGLSATSAVDEGLARHLANKITQEYKDNDYHHATVTSKVTPDPDDAQKVSVTFTINEQVPSYIHHVDFIGNTIIPGRTLRKYLQNSERWLLGPITGAGKYDAHALEIDKERIRMVYAEHGYFGARVTDTKVSFTKDKKTISILFTITEGSQFTIKDIDIAPDEEVPHRILRHALSLQPGDVYKQSELHKIMESIKKIFGDYGYIDAYVVPQVVPDTDSNTLSINFHVDKGKKWKLNKLIISGNEKTRDHVIRRKIVLEEGATITQAAMDVSRRNVEYLSYFDREGVTWKRHRLDSDYIDLELNVKEIPTRELAMGLDYGASSSDPNAGLKGNLSATLRNMMGQGWDTGLSIKGNTSMLSDISVFAADQHLMNTNVSGSMSFVYAQAHYDQWHWVVPSPKETTLGLTGRLGMLLPTPDRSTSMHIETGMQNIKNNLYNTKTDEASYRFRDDVLASQYPRLKALLEQKLQAGWLYWVGLDVMKDTRNHMIYPSDGYRLVLSSKFAPPLFNSAFSFFKITGDASWYTPLIGSDALVLGLHAHAGVAGQIGLAETEKSLIPYRELFHLGGQNSIRGFNWGQVAPSWEYANPLGGTKAIQLNAELIFPFLNNHSMKVHLFYDAGCAWDTPKTQIIKDNMDLIKNDSFNMRHTIGIGLNITQPNPLKISFGYKLDQNKKAGETPHEFHIGMNTAF